MPKFNELYSEDYLIKARAFVELTWIEKREDLLPVLCNIILNELEDEWRLRALDVLAVWQAKEEIPNLEKLYLDNDPVMVRGLMWFIITVGDKEAVYRMLEFAVSPRGRIIRFETVLEMLTQAIQKNNIIITDIEEFKQNNTTIKRFIDGWDFNDDLPRLLTVYPSADYIALRCKEKGIPFKDYKKINYKNNDIK